MGWGSFRHFLLLFAMSCGPDYQGERGWYRDSPLHNLNIHTTHLGLHRGVPEGWNTPVCPWATLQTHHIACKQLFRKNHLSSFASCCCIQLFESGLPENFMPALPTCKVPCPDDKLSLQQDSWYTEV